MTVPQAWCPQTTLTHRVVRLPWLPRRVRRWVPERWQYRVCTTEAPARMCRCRMYSLQWAPEWPLEGPGRTYASEKDEASAED